MPGENETINLKVSRNPVHQDAVNKGIGRLQAMDPEINLTTANTIARDRVAWGLTRGRLRRRAEFAFEDELTGLPNKRAFAQEETRKIGEAQRNHTPLFLVIYDVDHFKGLNDQFGYLGANDALKAIGMLKTRDTDPLHRWGGDEFVRLVAGDGSHELTLEMITGIVSRDRGLFRVLADRFYHSKSPQHGYEGPVNRHPTMSMGIARYIEGETPEEFFKRANTALTEANKIKNTAFFAEPTESGELIKTQIDFSKPTK
jgi:diguanylate cyclase (GGDEF)-like protein